MVQVHPGSPEFYFIIIDVSRSSSGPGLRIFIPATGVRFPYGIPNLSAVHFDEQLFLYLQEPAKAENIRTNRD